MFDEPERLAAEKILAARRLVSRGRLREALDALNLAIQLDSSNPEAFRDRADVFERMFLGPQAEADRQRAAALAAALPTPPVPPPLPQPPETPAVPADAPLEPEEPTPAIDTAQPAAETAFYVPDTLDIPREPGRGPGAAAALLAALVVLVFVTGIAGGIIIAAGSIDWGSLDPFGGDEEVSPSATPFGATGTATGGGGTSTATAEPSTPANASTTGDPYSLSNLESAWEAKGLTVKAGAAGEGFTGFKTAPVDVTMTRGGSSATASVFVYKTRDAALAEWDLVPGSRPTPKGSRTLPSNVSAWWNANVVVVLRTDPAGLGSDALDGLLNLGG